MIFRHAFLKNWWYRIPQNTSSALMPFYRALHAVHCFTTVRSYNKGKGKGMYT